ncbi:RNA polymerase sigma factor [Frigoribacterium sp. 2-23]|uniref:RNA polymerase sigma factor n=1 Tax=Frigoribacterium sp. 2-23 TaxID=3415006 RepID=UPI003C6F7D5C
MIDASRGFDLRAAFAEHGSELFAVAVNALRDRGQAEDCVQETFLRAWRARDRFDPTLGSVRTWLFAIERRVVLDVFRARERVPRTVPHDDARDVDAGVADPLERLRMVEGLARLSAEQREAVVAVHLDGATYAELASVTGVSIATLRTRVFYGLRALRSHLDGTTT